MAYTYQHGVNKGQKASQAEIYNTAPTEVGGLYKQRFDAARSSLQPMFNQARGSASTALGTRGLGRTSMYGNAMADITGKENLATQELYGSILKEAQGESMQRDFQGMAQSRFNVDLDEKRRQYDENMRWQDYQHSERQNEARKARAAKAKGDTWGAIGKIGAAIATGGASLAVPGGGFY
jgi:hypothetical protein